MERYLNCYEATIAFCPRIFVRSRNFIFNLFEQVQNKIVKHPVVSCLDFCINHDLLYRCLSPKMNKVVKQDIEDIELSVKGCLSVKFKVKYLT